MITFQARAFRSLYLLRVGQAGTRGLPADLGVRRQRIFEFQRDAAHPPPLWCISRMCWLTGADVLACGAMDEQGFVPVLVPSRPAGSPPYPDVCDPSAVPATDDVWRILRAEWKGTVSSLAAVGGFTESMASQWSAGTRAPRLSSLLAVAVALRLDLRITPTAIEVRTPVGP